MPAATRSGIIHEPHQSSDETGSRRVCTLDTRKSEVVGIYYVFAASPKARVVLISKVKTPPRTAMPAATRSGILHEPHQSIEYPKTSGLRAPPILPKVFMIAVTVPAASPPTS